MLVDTGFWNSDVHRGRHSDLYPVTVEFTLVLSDRQDITELHIPAFIRLDHPLDYHLA